MNAYCKNLFDKVKYYFYGSKMKPGKVDYNSNSVPKKYKCGTCKVHGCKLWREYNTFLDQQTLECCDCAAKSQGKDVSTIDHTGRYKTDIGMTDQIGWRIPAVPTEDGETFWGYSSVPQAGVNWWKALPTRLDKA